VKNAIAAALLLVLGGCASESGPVQLSSRSAHPASNPNAAVLVVEYTDLQCPSCRRAHETIVKPLLASHGSQIRYELRHFPLRSLHRHALDAAMAAECAADQGKFWDYTDLAFRKQPQMSRENLRAWGAEISLDMPRFEQCLASEAKREIVLSEYREGKKRDVIGTPTFFVNQTKVEGTLGAIEAAIEAANRTTEPRR